MKNFLKIEKRDVFIFIPAFIFSLFMVMGKEFLEYETLDHIFANSFTILKSCFVLICYFLLFYLSVKGSFCLLTTNFHLKAKKDYQSIDKYISWKRYKKLFFTKLLQFVHFILNHTSMIWLVIILAWLPYLISYYPGIFMGDTSMQIFQANFAVGFDWNSINTQHPVVHTLMIKLALLLGNLLQSDNLGLFIYTSLQFLCITLTLAFTIRYLQKLKLSTVMRIILLLAYCIIPLFPMLSLVITKDIFFSCFIIWFSIFLIEIILDQEKIFNRPFYLFLFTVTVLGALIFRKNGIIAVIPSIFFLLFYLKRKYQLKLLFITAIVLVISSSLSKLWIDVFQVGRAGIRDAFSIPVQQTARYIKEHEEELTEEEIEAIDSTWDYEALRKYYEPNQSDKIRRTMKTLRHSKQYIKAWFSMFLKHPETYIQATLNNYYGYLYLHVNSSGLYYQDYSCKIQRSLDEYGFQYSHPDNLKPVRTGLENMIHFIESLPVISLLHSSSFYIWILLLCISFLLYISQKKWVLALMPGIFLFITCMLSPMNGNIYYRFSMPIMYSVPLFLGCAKYALIQYRSGAKLTK